MRTLSAAPTRSVQHLPALLWLAVGHAAVATLAVIAQYLVLVVMAPPDLSLAVPAVDQRVAPDATMTLTVAGVGALSRLSLSETILDRGGHAVAERLVPVRLAGRHEGLFHERFTGAIQAAAGGSPLRSDAQYRLTAIATLWAFAVPLPTRVSLQHEVEFSTPRTPQPVPAPPDDAERTLPRTPQPVLAPNGRQLHYGESLAIAWNVPMAAVEATVEPPTRLMSWIDPREPTRSYVALPDAADGRGYTVRIRRARSVENVELPAPSTFQVIAPAGARAVVPGETVPIGSGQRVPVVWTVPIQRFDVRTDPPVPVDVAIDEEDRRRSTIGFGSLRQGQTYAVEVSAAVAENGAPLAAPLRFQVVTAAALELVRVEPADGSANLVTGTAPVLTFAGGIADRRGAEAAIRLDPPVPGRFEWPAENEVRFVPNDGWPAQTRITIRVGAGPNGPRGVGGGYLAEPITVGFTTAVKKVIDVDLSRQRLVLLEDDRPVFESPAATGVPGGETPPGTFSVQYKMPTAHFRGVNPNGSTYDIPDVPWVIPFLGDYTIHGAPWRRAFGTPGSAGCVSLPTEAARTVYDWAPVGTPIIIHY